MSPEQVQRIDGLIGPMLDARTDTERRESGGRITRSRVLRAALERGIVVLEAELRERKTARR